MCNCTPWNYVHFDNENSILCDGVGAYCFEESMNQQYNSTECRCFPNCEQVMYHADYDRAKINYKRECSLSTIMQSSFSWNTQLAVEQFSDVNKKYDVLDLLGEKIR